MPSPLQVEKGAVALARIKGRPNSRAVNILMLLGEDLVSNSVTNMRSDTNPPSLFLIGCRWEGVGVRIVIHGFIKGEV
jgi:hypothetical protein